MKAIIGVAATLAISVVLIASVFGQEVTTPSQPQDPTAQAPATPPQSTPPTFPKSDTGEGKSPGAKSAAEASSSVRRALLVQPFVGTVVRLKNSYVLRAGDSEYRPDSPSTAKKYLGHNVKIIGILDKTNNTIRVQIIKESPPS